jgi:CRP-like cAMP-binding protein
MNATSLPLATNTFATSLSLGMRVTHPPKNEVATLEPLFNYVTTFIGMQLSAVEKFQLQKTFKMKTLRRRQFFLQEGDVCKHIGFIVKGAMRMFSINEKGQESIINFGLENNWMMDQESFSMLIPSRYHIEAMEDTELLIVSNSQLQLLMDEIPAIDRMMRLTDRQKLISTQQRVHAAISMTAEERYHNLLTAHPEYTQRFSQNMIAAYLGIKSETLSRIRKR